MTNAERGRQNIERADRELLEAWLAELSPADGFKGPAKELWETIVWFGYVRQEQFPRMRLPHPIGLLRWLEGHGQFLESLGWAVGRGRTNTGRFITLARRPRYETQK